MEGCCNMKMVNSNTPQGGLGQMDIVEGVFSFATGLFSKDPQKTEYDRVRQGVWDSIVQLVDEHDHTKAAGALSRSFVQHCISAMTQLLEGFKKYTDGMLAKYPSDAGWINPRFHDYYDFGMGVRTSWQQELATLPADITGGVVDYIQDFFGGGSGPVVNMPQFPNTTPYVTPQTQVASVSSGTNMLLIGGVLVGAFLLFRKGR